MPCSSGGYVTEVGDFIRHAQPAAANTLISRAQE